MIIDSQLSTKPAHAPMERKTNQRTAIREAFRRAARPLSPAEAHAAARARQKTLGLATVYRAVRTLVEEGWLVAVEVPGEPARYEVAGKPHHHHFHCRACGKVYEVEGCPGDLKRLTPRGFRLEGHEVTLLGVCAVCRPAAG